MSTAAAESMLADTARITASRRGSNTVPGVGAGCTRGDTTARSAAAIAQRWRGSWGILHGLAELRRTECESVSISTTYPIARCACQSRRRVAIGIAVSARRSLPRRRSSCALCSIRSPAERRRPWSPGGESSPVDSAPPISAASSPPSTPVDEGGQRALSPDRRRTLAPPAAAGHWANLPPMLPGALAASAAAPPRTARSAGTARLEAPLVAGAEREGQQRGSLVEDARTEEAVAAAGCFGAVEALQFGGDVCADTCCGGKCACC
ncbi:hypothetical protein CLOP_g11060 [Closterium sp. NIES-67]|nr:hypothetical protein CLOP_g11060 [Closterium sp. NIES-67]